MITLAEAEKAFINQLKSLYGAGEAKSLAFYVIHHLYGMSKSHFLLNRREPIDEITETSLIRILEELKTGKPVQYILGETEFYGLPFKVNPSVLIPRQETEELVEWVIEEVRSPKSEVRSPKSGVRSRKTEDGSPKSEIRNRKSEIRNILDIGTGSGCIAIALKKHIPKAIVYGLDISPEALETARQNALLNSTEIEFLQVDILKDTNQILNTKFSIIISNPPYITIAEKHQMHIHVIDHEPHSALFVPDNKPLIFYEHIIDFATTHLFADGLLFFEINGNFGNQVISLLDKKGFSDIELRKDLQGKDRMIKARFK